MALTNWYGNSLLKLADYSQADVLALLALAHQLKQQRQQGIHHKRLIGKNIALIFEKMSSRTRCAFEIAIAEQGGHAVYIGAGSSQLGDKESAADTARLFGRLFDAIQYRGYSQTQVEILAEKSGVPVYNGLTDDFHPTQMLADLMTMQEHSDLPLNALSFVYLGDARNNMGHSLLLAGALMGMNVRIAAPKALQPKAEIVAQARALAEKSGASIAISDNAEEMVQGADFVHTDIWLSMGEDKSEWHKRVELLLPYRVSAGTMALAAPNAKFMHCLPSFHDRNTPAGEAFYRSHQLNGIEVDNNVFESEASIVFDQAENRLHTIKALLIATLCRDS